MEKVLYLVIPCYNEEEVLDETAKQIQSKADDAVSDLQKKGEEIKEKLQDLISKQKESKAEKTEE